MLAATVIMVALTTNDIAFPTAISYFKAAIQEKDIGKKSTLIENGLACLYRIDDEKNGEQLDRLFTLYLGFLAADLPFDIIQNIALTAVDLEFSAETRALAVQAFDGYLVKLKASTEDVAEPYVGPSTGLGQMKPSEWLETICVRHLKSKNGVRKKK